MMGSGAFAGIFDLDDIDGRTDVEGKRFGEELERIGYKGEGVGDRPAKAYFEAHIEQGPILETEKKTIRSAEHTSELQSLMRISYAVFCWKKKTTRNIIHHSLTLRRTTVGHPRAAGVAQS